MQDIHIRRYKDNVRGWLASIEPDDRSWIVFIDAANQPHFWLRRERKGDGCEVLHEYARA